MTAFALLITTLIVLVAGHLSVLAALVVTSSMQSRQKRREPLIDSARQSIVAVLSADDEDASVALEGLVELSPREKADILLDLVTSVGGSSQQMLGAIAEEVGILPAARLDIESRRWSRRLYAARVLTAFGVRSDSVAMLLQDRAPEVRAQAATWAAVAPSEATTELLLTMLDDSDGLCRFAAQDALVRISSPAVPGLVDILVTGSGPLTERAVAVAGTIGDDRFSAALTALTADPSPEVRSVAATALAGIGDPTGEVTLIGLLSDESAVVRRAAARALATLGCWPASPSIETLLNDDVWAVRREAALALSALGPIGQVLLRANAQGAGRSAVMAVQILEINALTNDLEMV